jgi:hypothetical protein
VNDTVPTITAEHVSRLIELRDHLIEIGPDKFEMSSWFTIQDDADICQTFGWDELTFNLDRAADLIESGQHCGTAACLAGHAVLLWPEIVTFSVDDEGNSYSIDSDDVAKYLGMDVGAPNEWQVDRWFSTQSWPDRFRIPYKNATRDLDHQLMMHRDLDVDTYVERDLMRTHTQRKLQHDAVLLVLDELIHGRMRNWHDDDTSAVDVADLADAQP